MGKDLGEDVGEEPPKKKKAVKKAGTRAYNSKRIAVTDPYLKFALNHIWQSKALYKRNPENGHMFQGLRRRIDKYADVRFAEYYGRLNKAGVMGPLHNIILSSQGKVYQLEPTGRHVEIKWQNDKEVSNPPYETIRLIGEGGNYQCSILNAFKNELSLYL